MKRERGSDFERGEIRYPFSKRKKGRKKEEKVS